VDCASFAAALRRPKLAAEVPTSEDERRDGEPETVASEIYPMIPMILTIPMNDTMIPIFDSYIPLYVWRGTTYDSYECV